nr:cupredoxin domain-containing protein [Corynebacterium variabile]
MVACADKDDDAPVFTVTADDSTCDVDSYDATTGNNNFEVTNNGKKITEFYVYTDGGRVVGEVENIGPGATRKLLVSIPEAGTYQATCKPGMVGEGISHDLNVTGDSVDLTEGSDTLTAAVEGYLRYVRSQTTALQEQTDTFVQAIQDGDLETAKSLFAPPVSTTSASSRSPSPSPTTWIPASTCVRSISRTARSGPSSTGSRRTCERAAGLPSRRRRTPTS